MSITDRIRERWRRKRQELGLTDLEAEDFGGAGLARHVKDRAARLLILPADPERSDISFVGDFWNWWETDRSDPANGSVTRWGSLNRSCSSAALRIEERSTMEWRRYIAVHRSGALEMVLGRDGAFDLENPARRMFRLTVIVGRVWAALSLYRAVIERHDPHGPWEVGLALLRTDGAILCCFGRDWREPTDVYGPFGHCFERNVWISRELTAWPTEDGIKDLAFDLGGRIEDAWGVRERRFLFRNGERAGEFDAAKYGWHD
jgi:hypothetical protein